MASANIAAEEEEPETVRLSSFASLTASLLRHCCVNVFENPTVIYLKKKKKIIHIYEYIWRSVASSPFYRLYSYSQGQGVRFNGLDSHWVYISLRRFWENRKNAVFRVPPIRWQIGNKLRVQRSGALSSDRRACNVLYIIYRLSAVDDGQTNGRRRPKSTYVRTRCKSRVRVCVEKEKNGDKNGSNNKKSNYYYRVNRSGGKRPNTPSCVCVRRQRKASLSLSTTCLVKEREREGSVRSSRRGCLWRTLKFRPAVKDSRTNDCHIPCAYLRGELKFFFFKGDGEKNGEKNKQYAYDCCAIRLLV